MEPLREAAIPVKRKLGTAKPKLSAAREPASPDLVDELPPRRKHRPAAAQIQLPDLIDDRIAQCTWEVLSALCRREGVPCHGAKHTLVSRLLATTVAPGA